MADSIYRELILDHWRNPRNYGLKGAKKRARVANLSCGDVIEAGEVGGRLRFEGEGCAIAIAATSMIIEKLQKSKTPNLQAIENFKIKDIEKMMGVKISSGREKCAMIGLEAVRNYYA